MFYDRVLVYQILEHSSRFILSMALLKFNPVISRNLLSRQKSKIPFSSLDRLEIQFNYPTTKNLYLFIYAILRLSFMSNFCAEFPHKLLLLILNCSGLDTHYIVYLVKTIIAPSLIPPQNKHLFGMSESYHLK